MILSLQRVKVGNYGKALLVPAPNVHTSKNDLHVIYRTPQGEVVGQKVVDGDVRQAVNDLEKFLATPSELDIGNA